MGVVITPKVAENAAICDSKVKEPFVLFNAFIPGFLGRCNLVENMLRAILAHSSDSPGDLLSSRKRDPVREEPSHDSTKEKKTRNKLASGSL